MKAVAAGDEVARELARLAGFAEADHRRVRIEVADRYAGNIEADIAARVESRLDQVLDDLVLAVDGHCLARRELGEVDPVRAPREAELDAVMNEPFTLHALADPRLDEQVDCLLLEHSGANALLDILATAVLEHDRFDAGKVQQVGKQETRRSGAHDADLCAKTGHRGVDSCPCTMRQPSTVCTTYSVIA